LLSTEEETMSKASIILDLRYLQRKIDLIIKEIETGPESSREEVAPMGKNTTRDWSMMRLAAASLVVWRRHPLHLKLNPLLNNIVLRPKAFLNHLRPAKRVSLIKRMTYELLLYRGRRVSIA
jgi:hypothetical protein